jgi:hypothetical protein
MSGKIICQYQNLQNDVGGFENVLEVIVAASKMVPSGPDFCSLYPCAAPSCFVLGLDCVINDIQQKSFLDSDFRS